jgi:hypothetical protein
MPGILRLIWKDISSGTNCLYYLTIAVAVVVSVLGFLEVASPALVSSAVLFALSPILWGMVEEQWYRKEMKERSANVGKWSDKENQMRQRLMRASKVYFLGVSPIRILQSLGAELNYVLGRENAEIRFLAVNPSGHAMDLIEHGRPENRDDGIQFRKLACGDYKTFIDCGKFQIREMNYIPSHILTIIDADAQDGLMFATPYSFKQTDPNRPSFTVEPSQKLRWDFFKQEFKSLWEHKQVSIPFQCPALPSGPSVAPSGKE